jgi:hypothetical protein
LLRASLTFPQLLLLLLHLPLRTLAHAFLLNCTFPYTAALYATLL